MNCVPLTELEVAGGVDTHQDQHVAAVLDREGTVLGVEFFPTTQHGYLSHIAWMRGYGALA
jgi:transposase